VAHFRERFESVSMSAGSNLEKLLPAVAAHRPKVVSVKTREDAARLRQEFPGLSVGFGPHGLGNREPLVVAGEPLMAAARASGAAVLPVDSELCALHQALRAGTLQEVKRLVLTASGGPFRTRDFGTLPAITVDDALQHPTWRMGPKITIASATMMNKGLEIIEARWLFDVPGAKIDVV